MHFLMCKPQYYGIYYEINPWMNLATKAIENHVLDQWQTLYQTLINLGVEIDLIEPKTGWPDMCFTANAGLYYHGKIILPHFKYKERQGEVTYFAAWFEKAGFKFFNSAEQTPPYFEGAGDALLMNEKLFAAFGFRSDKAFYEQAEYIDKKNLVYCELVDPYYYHLDTCFCPLNNKTAIWYPHAFSRSTQSAMENEIELIEVEAQEAKLFACNAVVVDDNVILPQGATNIAAALEKRNFTIHTCAMDEFIKAGGACKCLTLRIA